MDKSKGLALSQIPEIDLQELMTLPEEERLALTGSLQPREPMPRSLLRALNPSPAEVRVRAALYQRQLRESAPPEKKFKKKAIAYGIEYAAHFGQLKVSRKTSDD